MGIERRESKRGKRKKDRERQREKTEIDMKRKREKLIDGERKRGRMGKKQNY